MEEIVGGMEREAAGNIDMREDVEGQAEVRVERDCV